MENKIINNQKKFIEELCNEHNKIRKNPQCYIGFLRRTLNLIRRNNILHLENERPFKTIEGKEAVMEAINFLSNIPKSLTEKLSKQLLTISDYLSYASFDHAKDIGINGTCSHIGPQNNSHMNERVEKYCDWKGGLAESLDFGTLSPKNIMIKLLLCDGDKKRSQRQYIFDPGFIFFGASFYNHIKYKRCSVISYAGFVQSKDAKFSEKEAIRNYLNIHNYFIYKNKDEFENYIKNKKLEKKEEINKNIEKEKIYEKKEVEYINKKEDNFKVEEKEIDNEKAQENVKDENKEDKKIIEESLFEIKDENENLKESDEEEENNSFNDNNLVIIEENENDNEKANEKEENNKITEISHKVINRYGVEIKETIYKIKEGNYHIVEEESKQEIFNFLNLF